jgi:hypothetical protein
MILDKSKRIHSGEIRCIAFHEFSKAGYICHAEIGYRRCRFDIVITKILANGEEEIQFVIECKNYKKALVPKAVNQHDKYMLACKNIGVPLIYILRPSDIHSAIQYVRSGILLDNLSVYRPEID